MLSWAALAAALALAVGQVLNPPYFNLAQGKAAQASSTCGLSEQQRPIRELYCSLAASSYNPYGTYFSFNQQEDQSPAPAQLRADPRDPNGIVQGGQSCQWCDAVEHGADKVTDGGKDWWQSPPLSRSFDYNAVNITISLHQEFHVAYVSIQMANSPRPGAWVLERSRDHGETWLPWQYFAQSAAECQELFGPDSNAPILADDSVICTTEHSNIVPLENGQIYVRLLNQRPSRFNFSHSEALQNFTRATDVRLRLLKTNTLQGHLMGLTRQKDPTITRRYFYSIKEIEMGGRCVCHGHAQTCDILDPARPDLLCRCEHRTCGDQCQTCCPGFRQKAWRPSRDSATFTCEPCNCFGHAEDCEYDQALADAGTSLDIHGNYEGGGRCLSCRDNTEGTNCHECAFGFFRPTGKQQNETDACSPCTCDPAFHSGDCVDGAGKCLCKANFLGPDCDACAPGYYDFEAGCKPCDCNVNGTDGDVCLPEEGGVCPCKDTFGGPFCDRCADDFFGFPDCKECECESAGSLSNNCSQADGQCPCKGNFGGANCAKCGLGYFKFPTCDFCNCDPSGTEEGVCDAESGQCLCKPGYAGERCDQCLPEYYGYPDCKQCECGSEGSEAAACAAETGQCPCRANFTGRQCEKCAVGFFNFPACLACNCDAAGSQGVTCDARGACFCKPNFSGPKCADCRPNFYNHPVCEECNCNPSGVSADFAGCDSVPAGELCTCKPRVSGRICDSCQSGFWDLQYHNAEGCSDCDCYRAGSASRLNDCSGAEGRCPCKANAGGRTCAKCADGFFDLREGHALGCSSCDCDVGGAFSGNCDEVSGQCRCKPRVEGRRCRRPISAHYYPHLHHLAYEAEDGRTEASKPVRMAVDAGLFANFTWKGYAVFSPIQSQVLLDVDIPKANLYRVLFRFVNPTPGPIEADVSFSPYYTHSDDDVEQSIKTELPKTSSESKTLALVGKGTNIPHPFVLNPGKWILSVKTKQRLFLDSVVLLPSAYYEGTLLKEKGSEACRADDYASAACLHYVYPELPADLPTAAAADLKDADGNGLPTLSLPDAPPEFPADLAEAKLGTDDVSGELTVAGPHVILVEYFRDSGAAEMAPATLGIGDASAELSFQDCPYSSPCRELGVRDGLPAVFQLSGPTTLTLKAAAPANVSISRVLAVPAAAWRNDFLIPRPRCLMSAGKCLEPEYRNAEGSARVSAEELERSSSREEPAYPDMAAVSNDHPEEATLDVFGVVPMEGHFTFMLNYINHGLPVDLPVALHSDKSYTDATGKNLTADTPGLNSTADNAVVKLEHCPSVSGCRVVIKRTSDGSDQFYVPKSFLVTLRSAPAATAPVWVGSVAAVPFHMFTPELLETTAPDGSQGFLSQCAADNFYAAPAETSEFCKAKIFSLTADFNTGAFACECNPQGSTGFACEVLGGQCPCRENVIGRQCSRCKPGFFDFPNCQPCKCGEGRQCHERTGQCLCRLHVEGQNCDRCEVRAFGFDPLIGCQLCDCHADGSEGGRLECDQLSGQCLCKASVGGRKCDECLAGFYGFPFCYACNCEAAGATPGVCDQATAACTCKANVEGQSCASCVAGTFNLAAGNPLGCASCFCFGTTDQCSSSYWATMEIPVAAIPEAPWALASDAEGLSLTEVTDSVVEVVAGEGAEVPQDVYFQLPSSFMGQNILWYGGFLRYSISSTSTGEGAASAAPDAVLRGANKTLEFWSTEQPPELGEPFTLTVPFGEDVWRKEGGGLVSRGELMMVLHGLSSVELKASYALPFRSAILTSPVLGTVDTAVQAPIGSPLQAAAIEVCACPAPYSGTSCQDCSDGYYRASEGAWLGACVPCQCNNHAATCDKASGICLDCRDGTRGEHCEECVSGQYGDATKGTPYDCQTCPCPHPTAENNFADACGFSEAGSLQFCNCTAGYTGARCEFCSAGFFGDPLQRGGSCAACDCNGNNDLSQEGACDARSGLCAACANDTSGPACETCAPWFHGDAVEAKNCSGCACDQCGSEYCDVASGMCACRELVEGDNCDRCAPEAWGFSTCAGCRQCNCASASLSGQCDDEGQCACLEGVEGRQCERCINGFWSYGPTGCQKCDCESDLSQGTVCDVATGQCQCQPGATGPRCDQCLPGYLRVPVHGCLFCDECVHVLADDLGLLGGTVGEIGATLGNTSTHLLVGSKLRKLNESAELLRPRVDALVATASDGGLDNVAGSGMQVRDAAASLLLQAERSRAAANATVAQTEALLAKTAAAQEMSRDKLSGARRAVMDIKALEESLKDNSASKDRDSFVAEAAAVLAALQARNFTDTEEAVTAELEAANQLLAKVSDWSGRSAAGGAVGAESRSRLELLQSKVEEAEALQAASGRRAAEALAVCAKTAANPILKSGTSIAAEKAACEENMAEATMYLEDARATLDAVKDDDEELRAALDGLNATTAALEEKAGDSSEGLEEATREIPSAQRRAEELEREAAILSRSFVGNSESAADAVSAADAHGEIAQLLGEAADASKEASVVGYEGAAAATGMDEAAQDAATLSMKLMRDATGAKETVVNNVTNTLASEDAALADIAARLKTAAAAVAEVKAASDFTNVGEASETIRAKTMRATSMGNAAAEFVAKVEGKLAGLEEKAEAGVADAAAAARLLQTARQQLGRVTELLPNATERLGALHGAAGNASKALDDVETKLASLRSKIAFARDTANRIQVGATFARGSSLQLRNPPRITRSAANTHIQLHFQTSADGLLFFFGNEAGSGGSRLVAEADYLAAEVSEGRPKVTLQLGAEPLVITPNTNVRDGRWHRLTVERTGKLLRVRVETEGEAAVEAEAVAVGPKFVLNLHQTESKFFVGGVPDSARMPAGLVNRGLEGSIEELRYHGNRLGLWNFEHDGRVATHGAVQRNELLFPTESPSVRLNGEGYVEMPLEPWNPRKSSTISFSFKTFAQDALIFYIGKAPDFMSIELRGGQVLVQFDLGSGSLKLAAAGHYADGDWHSLLFKRNGTGATLALDNHDEVKGSSPGAMFELGTSDVYFVGGVPDHIVNAFAASAPRNDVRLLGVLSSDVNRGGFSGCIEGLTLDAGKMNLNSGARASLGSQPGCPVEAVRVASFPGTDAASLVLPTNASAGPLQLSLRFRTESDSGLLAAMLDEEEVNGLILKLEAGYVSLEQRRAGLDSVFVKTELSSASDGQWHFVSVERGLSRLSLDVDDLYHKETAVSADADAALHPSRLLFGSGNEDALPFAGCLGDVTLGSEVLDLSTAEKRGDVSLVGCTMAEAKVGPTPATAPRDSRKSNSIHSTIVPAAKSARNESRCALQRVSLGAREDSAGTRFGLLPNSRLEFARLPEAFDTNAELGVEFRATASEGILLYAGDRAHSDHVALYLEDGHVVFSFDSGSGALRLRSARRFLDGEWHSVLATKERKAGRLRVDDVEEARGEGPGENYAADTTPPFYVGGVPPDLSHKAAAATAGVKSSFGGCLRGLRLNRLDFGDASHSVGPPVPCTTFSEPGLFFGPEGAYAVLQPSFTVGTRFSLEMSIKPRVENAVLLAVAASASSDALVLQLVRGSLVFTVDNGDKAESIQSPLHLCDGHWHTVTLYKTKNVVTMAVDGVSKLKVMRGGADLSTDTADPLYLAGVPESFASAALQARDPYVGCIRDLEVGVKPRQKRRIDLAQIQIFGDFSREGCPVN